MMRQRAITKITAVLLAGVLATGLGACGKKTEKKSTADPEDYDPAEYVTLPDYKGLAVTVSGDYSTEAALDELIRENAPYTRDDSATTVASDSIVNVDYVGKVDGTAFDGGSATDQTIDVQNNSDATSGTGYIDGFTAGLVGAAVGSTVDCPVTFPADYGSADLAGKAAVFTFTVNYVCRQTTRDDLTDDFIAAHFDVQNMADLEQEAASQAESDRKSDVRQAVVDEMKDKSDVKYPDGLVSARIKEYEKRFEASVLTDGESLEDYLSQTYNMSLSDFESNLKDNITDNLKTEIIFRAVADKEDIQADDDGFSSYSSGLMSQLGVTDPEQLYLYYGSTQEKGEQYLKNMYRVSQAVDFVADAADVTES